MVTSSTLCQVIISGCTFTGNWAGSYAGGIEVIKAGIVVSNSTFVDNYANIAGGAANIQLCARVNGTGVPLYQPPLKSSIWTDQVGQFYIGFT